MVQSIFYFKVEGKCAPAGYQEITYHMILYVNMDFTRKASFGDRGNQAETQDSETYASVVSR